MRWKPVGRDALLIYFADEIGDESLRHSLAITSELENNPPAGLVDFIPGFTSVLLEFKLEGHAPSWPRTTSDGRDRARPSKLEEIADALLARFRQLSLPALPEWPVHEIPVTYDGEDLERVGDPSEVVALHTAPTYRVHLLGFTPGFPYLAGLDPRLHTPRRAKPRLRVKAGAVGIGGAQTGIYTVDGPGGWNIIGHTSVKIYDPKRADAFLLKPGDRVKFIPA